MSGQEPNQEAEVITEQRLRFPEKVEYVVSPEAAIEAIENALEKVRAFREKELYFIRDVVGPLAPSQFRELLSSIKLDKLSFSYHTIINATGYLTALATLLGLHRSVDTINHYYRLAVLPFLDLMLREKLEGIEKARPFAWRLQRFLLGRLLQSVARVVDNLIHLVTLGWTFCPGIGEPDKETGFYNRFVFGRRCGFLDLGHFFNCAIIAYLYGEAEAKRRAESVEVSQRKMREKEWLIKLRKQNFLPLVTNLLWGYATSADTIEDRSSDWFGIKLGAEMRQYGNNGKIIEFFIEKWPRLVRGKLLGDEDESVFRRVYEILKLVIDLIRYRLGTGGLFDLVGYMRAFFEKNDALDPKNENEVPPDVFNQVIEFYGKKYDSEEWARYATRGWQVVIPQELWEKVVRHKWSDDGETELPVKIQLKGNGERVDPYFPDD